MTLPTSGLITINDRGARAATTFGSVAAVVVTWCLLKS
jgi:hypothetical protein